MIATFVLTEEWMWLIINSGVTLKLSSRKNTNI